MEMADMVKLLKERQGSASIEEFANKIGLRGSTLSRYYSSDRAISIDSVRKMADFFDKAGDSDMVRALASYSIGRKVP